MIDETVIKVKDITKNFRVYYDKGTTLKEKILFKNRRSYEVRSVLKGISFEVKRGEAIGLIGHNGCGKSTTLKLLTKIMYPDSGTIEMKGRVSSLIELGAGFHPDMTGRENIYTNAAIFGLTKKEIDERINDIITFSELNEFIDVPVRTYSSGMYMRLAFAVAINVDADIILIDEILAVGDAGFQTKCFNRLKEIKAAGTTIVIVSHSLGQIEQICERSYWIHEGKICMVGDPRDVHPEYMEYMMQERVRIAKEEELQRKKEEEQNNTDIELQKEVQLESKEEVPQELPKETQEVYVEQDVQEIAKESKEEVHSEDLQQIQSDVLNQKRWGNRYAELQDIRMMNSKGECVKNFISGEDITIQIFYKVNRTVTDAVFGIGIFRYDGMHCYGTNTRIDRLPTFNLQQNGVCEIKLPACKLITGRYSLDVAIEQGEGITVDYYRGVLVFDMYSSIADVGVARLEHVWNI